VNDFVADAFASILPPRQRASDLEGSTLGNWKLLKKLGSSGGFSVVYRACHVRAEMGDSAVKVFAFDVNENPDIRALFDREIGILKKLTDARDVRGVPRIYDADIEPSGLPWIAMQYINGKPLDAWRCDIKLGSGRPPTSQVIQILHDILAALDAIQQFYNEFSHSAPNSTNAPPAGVGFVHRDIKPSNVMVEETPAGPRAWVIDFGISRILQPALPASLPPQTATMTMAANALTIEYASPEMLVPHPAADARSDIFQVGLIGFELLTGDRFWDAWANQNRMLAAAKYPWWLKRAVRRALQWDRERRFPTARRFLLAITHPYRRAVYNNLLAACTMGVVVCLLTVAVFSNMRRHRLEAAYSNLEQKNTDLQSSLNNATANISGDPFGELVGIHRRLEEGTASNADIVDFYSRANTFLDLNPPNYQKVQVTKMLKWLDDARIGKVTITVRQLQANTWKSYAIDCGIDANGQSVRATKNVNADVDVDGCVLEVPWDPDINVKIWMHLTGSGYETCWGQYGPISLCSKEVLQDKSGAWREFFADQYDKDFKLGFTIERNFGPLPSLAQ
jgi:serine/threonine protein kinase